MISFNLLHIIIYTVQMSYREPLNMQSDSFPKVIFQTWKSHIDIPDNFRYWSQTWREHNYDYQYILWDDSDNRAFIAEKFPWFLSTYDGYKHNINRADAVRYFFLYYYGGIYADMDFECLQSFNSLLATNADAAVILGTMKTKKPQSSIPNAIMISKPRAPFWIYVFQQLLYNKNQATVEMMTGPNMLFGAIQAYNKKSKRPTEINRNVFLSPVNRLSTKHKDTYDSILSNLDVDLVPSTDTTLVLLAPEILYPISWISDQKQRVEALQNKDYEAVTQKSMRLYPTAYAVTYWTHMW